MKFRECTIGDHSNCILETKTEGKCSCICHCLESFESYMTAINSPSRGRKEIDRERDDTDCKW